MITILENLPLPIAISLQSIAIAVCVTLLVRAIRSRTKIAIPVFVCLTLVLVVTAIISLARHWHVNEFFVDVLTYILGGLFVLFFIALWVTIFALKKQNLVPQDKLYLIKYMKVAFVIFVCAIVFIILTRIIPKLTNGA